MPSSALRTLSTCAGSVEAGSPSWSHVKDNYRPATKAKSGGKSSRRSVIEEAMALLPEPKPERRALSHVGGKIRFWGGTDAERAVLTTALSVESDEEVTQAHLHGFHSYPARLHPSTARELIEGLSAPGQLVFDPFCGSGTVPLEARLAGRRGYGADLNPFSVELASFKCTLGTGDRSGWLEATTAVCEFATERRKAKAGPLKKYGKVDLDLFDIHVLLELDSLRAGILKVRAKGTRRALALCLSAMMTKVSRRAGDSAGYQRDKRIAAGYTTKLFSKKVEELERRASVFADLLPTPAYASRIFECDARRLEPIHAGSVDLIVTSPPYPGVFDYLDHHADRSRWLGLRDDKFVAGELGARRQLEPLSFAAARTRWEAELGATLKALPKKLAPGGRVALVIADSVVAGQALYADDVMAHLERTSGLRCSCVASQPRPHFHKPTARAFEARGRQEHVFLLAAGRR